MVPGGEKEAKKHGYVDMAPGEKRCRNCAFGGRERSGIVWCSMFAFGAKGGGVCDEWQPEGPRKA